MSEENEGNQDGGDGLAAAREARASRASVRTAANGALASALERLAAEAWTMEPAEVLELARLARELASPQRTRTPGKRRGRG